MVTVARAGHLDWRGMCEMGMLSTAQEAAGVAGDEERVREMEKIIADAKVAGDVGGI